MADLTWIHAGISVSACEKQSPLELIDTRILLMHALKLSRVQLITQSHNPLSDEQALTVKDLIQRRVNGEPIAHLVGEREFFGLRFEVTPDVLIPRPDTELLVELALQYAPPNSQLLDMGTGSGAIAISVAHTRADLHVTATDISAAALAVAQKNASELLDQRAAIAIQFIQSDWYNALTNQQFHTIVSNPPYIVKNDQHLSQGDLRFEPINALTDHGDGLSAYREIIAGASVHLHAGGWLLMEHGYDQAEAVRALLAQHQFCEVQSWNDLAGIARVSGGRLLNHNPY
jgi:release factor glutamine methyltransferase